MTVFNFSSIREILGEIEREAILETNILSTADIILVILFSFELEVLIIQKMLSLFTFIPYLYIDISSYVTGFNVHRGVLVANKTPYHALH